jgi:hypothetical protein
MEFIQSQIQAMTKQANDLRAAANKAMMDNVKTSTKD